MDSADSLARLNFVTLVQGLEPHETETQYDFYTRSMKCVVTMMNEKCHQFDQAEHVQLRALRKLKEAQNELLAAQIKISEANLTINFTQAQMDRAMSTHKEIEKYFDDGMQAMEALHGLYTEGTTIWTPEWIVKRVKKFITDHYEAKTMDILELYQLAHTIIQLFVHGVLVYIVCLYRGIPNDPEADVADLLADPCLSGLEWIQRDGRCGLSKKIVNALYQSLGISTKPRIAPIQISSETRPDSLVSHSMSAFFDVYDCDEDDPDAPYPGRDWAYRKVLTMIREELTEDDCESFESALYVDAPRWLSFLPSVNDTRIFNPPGDVAKSTSSEVNASANTSTVSKPETGNAAAIEALDWNATFFPPTLEEQRRRIRHVQTTGGTDIGDDLFYESWNEIVIWSPSDSSPVTDESEINDMIFDHEPFYGNLDVLYRPIVTLTSNRRCSKEERASYADRTEDEDNPEQLK